MTEKEIIKLNQEVVKMSSLDLLNFIGKQTENYQDVGDTVNFRNKEVVIKTILALKYQVFTLEESRKKWVTCSFFITIILLSVLMLFLPSREI